MAKATQLLLSIIFSAGLPSASIPATVERNPDAVAGKTLIIVQGELQHGDQQKFVNTVLGLSDAVIVLDSPGGDLLPGLEIGRAISLKGFTTVILDGFTCASACAFAWLGGVRRYMGPEAKIGFHAAFELSNGSARERGAPNAVLGAYLGALGLPDSAIYYATSSPPEGMNWLNFQVAADVGIEVHELGSADSNEAPGVRLPGAEPGPPEYPADTQSLQEALTRAGCYTDKIDGTWGPKSIAALQEYADRTGKDPVEAIRALPAETGRVCPPKPRDARALNYENGRCFTYDGTPYILANTRYCSPKEIRTYRKFLAGWIGSVCYTEESRRRCSRYNYGVMPTEGRGSPADELIHSASPNGLARAGAAGAGCCYCEKASLSGANEPSTFK